VQFQLVPVRIKKIERRPFAFVGFPDGDVSGGKRLYQRVEVLRRDGEGIVGIVAVLRRNILARVVVREAKPEIAAGEVRPGIPFGMQAQAEKIAPEDDAGGEMADGEGKMV